MRRPTLLRKSFIVYLCMSMPFTLVAAPTHVDPSELSRVTVNESLGVQKGSIFVDGDESMDSLIPVRIFGAVAKAGIHYVPQKIDVVTLISLAGGTTSEAELTKVTIRRTVGGKQEIIKVDLEEEGADPSTGNIILLSNDTVFVPQIRYLISEGVSRTISLITGVAAVVISAVAIANSGRKN